MHVFVALANLNMEEFLKMMIPDSAPQTPVATLVFMDLETTGLPTFVGKKNVHITEMSLVAVDRNDFEDESTALRVLNKLSLCIQPRTMVSYGAMKVTGLCNDILQNQQTFDISIPKLLEVFFCRLREPICLLAHNGKSYDFPILQAELKRLGYSFPKNILCADTLEAFRTMGLVSPNGGPCATQASNEEGEMTDEAIDKLLTEDLDIFKNVDVTKDLSGTKNENHPIMNKLKTQECYNSHAGYSNHCSEDILSFIENERIEPGFGEKTPGRIILKAPQNGQCYTQDRVSEITHHSLQQQRPTSLISKSTHAKRKLFETENESNGFVETGASGSLESPSKRSRVCRPAPKRVRYSLDKIYIHYFGEMPPNHHHAESDCINLSKICQNISRSFLPWLDKNNMSFCLTTPLW